jgi:hypothetical protein
VQSGNVPEKHSIGDADGADQYPVAAALAALKWSATWPARKTTRLTIAAAGVWLIGVSAVMASLVVYSNLPGNSGMPPNRWPSESVVSPDGSRPTLVMLAHPKCPCTRASLGELELLVARHHGQFNAHVLFIKLAETPEDWAKTDLWRKAAAIHGVTVHCDNNGNEARRFQLETSGHTLLYDRGGQLVFHGGITLSRGHAGDNAGRDALSLLLRHERPAQIQTPVFGCPLGIKEKSGDVRCQP